MKNDPLLFIEKVATKVERTLAPTQVIHPKTSNELIINRLVHISRATDCQVLLEVQSRIGSHLGFFEKHNHELLELKLEEQVEKIRVADILSLEIKYIRQV